MISAAKPPQVRIRMVGNRIHCDGQARDGEPVVVDVYGFGRGRYTADHLQRLNVHLLARVAGATTVHLRLKRCSPELGPMLLELLQHDDPGRLATIAPTAES